MSKIKIQIIGPTGSGKSVIANLLRFQLENSVASVEMIDDEPPMENHVPSFILGQGGLSKTDVEIEIQTIQTRRSPE